MSKNKGIKQYGVALGILLIAVAFFMYMKATKPKQPAVKPIEKVWMVDVHPVHFQSLRPVYTLYGQVESRAEVKVTSPISGRIAVLSVKPGDFVEKGQVLLALDEQDRQIPVQKAQAQLAQAQAQLALQVIAEQSQKRKLVLEQKILHLKQQAVARTRQLMQKNLASQSALDQAQEAVVRQQATVLAAQLAVDQLPAKRQQLEAGVANAQAALMQAQLNAQRAVVVAPEAVYVTQVQVAQGDQVTPNAPLLSYYAPHSLEVKAEVPITLYPRFQQQFLNTPPISALESDRQLQFTLNRFASQATPKGVVAYFDFTNLTSVQKSVGKFQKNVKIPSPALLGELLTLEVALAPQPHSFAVPYTALYGSNKIYVVKEGRLQRVSVTLLGDVKVKGARWALLKGAVSEGALVMTTHLPNALTGLKVKVQSMHFEQTKKTLAGVAQHG